MDYHNQVGIPSISTKNMDGHCRSDILAVRSLVLSALYCQHVAIPVSCRSDDAWDFGHMET